MLEPRDVLALQAGPGRPSSARARRRIRAIRCGPRPSARRCRRSRPREHRATGDRRRNCPPPRRSATLTSSIDSAISPKAWPGRRRAEVEILADHVAHDPFEIDVLRASPVAVIAPSRSTTAIVGDLQRLFEVMGDVDDRDAAAGQVADHLEQHRRPRSRSARKSARP